MANTTIQLKKSGSTGNSPPSLNIGEVAINYADGKLFYKDALGGISYIKNTDSFSTVNANSSLILATSPTDILNIVPGNNITISTNTTSKTITIESTGGGGGGDGDLAAAAYAQANNASGNTVALQAVNNTQNTNITAVNSFTQAAFNEANTKVESFYQNTTPSIANTGDIWVNSDTGFEYTNFGNVSIPIWAETGPTGVAANTLYLQAVNDLQNTNIISINTFAQAAFNKANTGSGGDLAAAAYAQANSASGNTVALQAQMTTTNTNIISINTFAGSAFNSANAGVTLATAAYAQANNASGNTVALQAVNSTQNTNITAVNTFAGSAFASANAGVTLAAAAYAQANNASGNTVALQAVNTTQNTNITAVNTFAGSAFNSANAGVTLATAAFNSANAGVTLATAAYAQANNASGNTVALQAVNTTQNTNIISINTFAQAAFDKANTGGGGDLAAAAYAQANNASGNTVALQAVNTTQNTNITNVNTFAQAAFDKANTGGGGGGSSTGYLANSVIFADSTGTLSNTANLKFTSTNNVFEVNGEIHIANTSTASFGSIIFNAANNSIDFIITT